MERRTFIKSLAIGGAALAASGGYFEHSNRFAVASLEMDVFGGLKEPLRICLISDFHAPSYTFRLDKLTQAVNSFHPDFIFATGDIIDDTGNEPLIRRLFSGMKVKGGKYSILGNWEYWSNADLNLLDAYYRQAGFELLVNKTVELSYRGQDLRITGLDDWIAGKPDYKLLEDAGGNTAINIVLVHCPAAFDTIKDISGRASLTLSGHTHGGQIAPFGAMIFRPPGCGAYTKGLYRQGSRALYVSAGLGNILLPFRIGSRPELCLLTVR